MKRSVSVEVLVHQHMLLTLLSMLNILHICLFTLLNPYYPKYMECMPSTCFIYIYTATEHCTRSLPQKLTDIYR